MVLPHLSDEQEESKDYLMHIGILNEVTLELEKELEGTRNKLPSMRPLTITMDVENLILSQEKMGGQRRLGGFKTSHPSVLKVMV